MQIAYAEPSHQEQLMFFNDFTGKFEPYITHERSIRRLLESAAARIAEMQEQIDALRAKS